MSASQILHETICVAQRGHARTMRQFAEQEIVIPTGDKAGCYYSAALQPYTSLWFDAMQEHWHNRRAVVAPTQTGKTLTCSTVPVLYHLFELNEDVIYGLPTLEMAGDKWRRDIFPVLECSQYARFMPKSGRGSRAGTVTSIMFTNGVTLRFMAAGGSDKSVAGYTSRVLTITEIDGFDRPSELSREADRVTQMEARLRSYGKNKSVYMECTASIEEGRIWQEYLAGTASKIILPCLYCNEWVTPEREHFRGWQDATCESEARANGRFHCPKCDHVWSDEDRIQANKQCKIEHTNQSSTFGFRWSAVNNMFVDSGDIAFDEWNASRRFDRDSAEREMCQFVWAIPFKPLPTADYLTIESMQGAVKGYMRGVVPEWAEYVTVGVDCHRWNIYWCAVAWKKDSTAHILDYGVCDCPSGDIGEDAGMKNGLEVMHEFVTSGWQVSGSNTTRIRDLGAIDAGYNQAVIVNFCKAKGNYWPCVGQGHSHATYGGMFARGYTTPRTRGKSFLEVGEQWHTTKFANGVIICQHNVDWEKLWVQRKMQQPAEEPGAMTLFITPSPKEHFSFLKHITAEQLIEKEGEYKWQAITRNNHYLDALCLATTAARKLGVASLPDAPQTQQRKMIFKPGIAPSAQQTRRRGTIRTKY